APPAHPDPAPAPRPRLAARHADFTYARFDRDPHLVLEVGQGRRTADGALALRWTTDDDSGGRRIEGWHELSGEDSVMRPVPTSKSLVLDVHDTRVAFVQREDGAYERVRHASFHLDVDCEALRPGSEAWTVGWRWRGIDAQVARLGRDAVGEIRTLEFEAPAEGAQLWWSSEGRPLDREDVPMRYLDEPRIELVLR
ncbi:MAG: hypothetical protein V3T22_11535, partial [Planctomycetota bacterium]